MATSNPLADISRIAQAQGPFSQLLQERYQQPEVPQASGWEGPGAAVMDIGARFLEGAQRGRIQKYMAEAQERDRGLRNAFMVGQAILADQNQPESVKTRILQTMASLAASVDTGKAPKKGEGDGDPRHGVWHSLAGAVKSVFSAMSGGKSITKVEKADFNSIIGGMMGEQMRGAEEVNQAQQQLNQALAKARSDLEPKGQYNQQDVLAHPDVMAARQRLDVLKVPMSSSAQDIFQTLRKPPTYQEEIWRRGMQELEGAPPSTAMPISPVGLGKPPVAPPAIPSEQPGTAQRPLFGPAVQLPAAAQMVLQKQRFRSSNLYLVDKTGKHAATVQEYRPGMFREAGTNRALDPAVLAQQNLHMVTNLPPPRQPIKVGAVLGADRKYHMKFMDPVSHETWIDPSAVHVSGPDAELARLRRDMAFGREEDSKYTKFNSEIDRINQNHNMAQTRILLSQVPNKDDLVARDENIRQSEIKDAEKRRNDALGVLYKRYGIEFTPSPPEDVDQPLSAERVGRFRRK